MDLNKPFLTGMDGLIRSLVGRMTPNRSMDIPSVYICTYGVLRTVVQYSLKYEGTSIFGIHRHDRAVKSLVHTYVHVHCGRTSRLYVHVHCRTRYSPTVLNTEYCTYNPTILTAYGVQSDNTYRGQYRRTFLPFSFPFFFLPRTPPRLSDDDAAYPMMNNLVLFIVIG
jgi:hypothetical protein